MISGRVSVVIPVFNAEYLGEAIESVLAQGSDLLEILVVDDGSTNDCAAMAEEFGNPVQVIRQENRGPAAARNRGLAAARGEYIAFLDHDDVFTSDKFDLQTSRLDQNPEIDIVIGHFSCLQRQRDDDSAPQFATQVDELMAFLLGACMFRRRVFEQVGVLDETMPPADDWDWFTRAREAAVPMLIHRQVVLHYRLHDDNMSRDQAAVSRFLVKALRRSLARRRRSGGVVAQLPPLSTFLETEEESE